jgi:hypothetical protein
MLDWGRICLLHMKQILEMPSMGLNTCVSRKEAPTRSKTPTVVRISFAASCMRCQSCCLVSTVLAYRAYFVEVKAYQIKVRWPWWPRHRSLGTTTDSPSGIMPASPSPFSRTEMCWSTTVQKLHPLSCAQRMILNNWDKCLQKNRKYRAPINVAGRINRSSIFDSVSVRIPTRIIRDYSIIMINHSFKISFSARCVSAANTICKDIDIFNEDCEYTSPRLTDILHYL